MGHPCTTHQTHTPQARTSTGSAPAGAECKNTEKREADAEKAAKLAKALAEKERVANRTNKEEMENEKEARAAQAAQRKKDRDRKLEDKEGNLY
jgi:hypothetical protein